MFFFCSCVHIGFSYCQQSLIGTSWDHCCCCCWFCCVQSHFRGQPNFCVEFVLICRRDCDKSSYCNQYLFSHLCLSWHPCLRNSEMIQDCFKEVFGLPLVYFKGVSSIFSGRSQWSNLSEKVIWMTMHNFFVRYFPEIQIFHFFKLI